MHGGVLCKEGGEMIKEAGAGAGGEGPFVTLLVLSLHGLVRFV